MPITEFLFLKKQNKKTNGRKYKIQKHYLSICVLFLALKFKNAIFVRQQRSGSFKHIIQRRNGHQQNEACLCNLNTTKTTKGSCLTVMVSYLSLIIINPCSGYFSTPEGQASFCIIPKVVFSFFVFNLGSVSILDFHPPGMELCHKKVKDLRLASYNLFCQDLTL